jgi:hypothetical protein
LSKLEPILRNGFVTRLVPLVLWIAVAPPTFGQSLSDDRNVLKREPKQGLFSRLGWFGPSKKHPRARTVLLPSAETVMRRDHAKAGSPLDRTWENEKKALAAKHKAELEAYVERRLTLAQNAARRTALLARERYLVERNSRAASQPKIEKSTLGPPPPPKQRVILVDWRAKTPVKPSVPEKRPKFVPLPQQTPAKVVDSFVDAPSSPAINSVSQGLTDGFSVALAFLMLHVPSVALASFAIGVVQIRRHRARSGLAFVTTSLALGTVALFFFNW